ncbi:hypothetical protein BCIN_05g04500 [Botrytis cinerea B05.10]|uniref:Uncharacterized protein n=1 Tax=Botryotinia fuckeliana (strain B05.10) TaxID=332648 RepID=A0A384JHN6_BOTFB|nr:hypothetical protein BCIN_05g04500 [Botrytis cinerea B05.10]ATZ50060.1 hypothetical protein BCIN_05g04500 [Botrytis cinerea B05.10]
MGQKLSKEACPLPGGRIWAEIIECMFGRRETCVPDDISAVSIRCSIPLSPTTSIPDVAGNGNPDPIENNDNDDDKNNTLNETSQAEHETSPFKGLGLAQRLRLLEQGHSQTSYESSVSYGSNSLPPLPSAIPFFDYSTTVDTTMDNTVDNTMDTTVSPTMDHTVDNTVDTTVSPTMDHTVDTAIDNTVDNTMDTTVSPTMDHTVDTAIDNTVDNTVDTTVSPTMDNTIDTTIDNTVDNTVDTTVSSTMDNTVDTTMNPTVSTTVSPTMDNTVDTTVSSTMDHTVDTAIDTTVEETVLLPTNEQPSFPYTIYNFDSSGLVISDISGINVEEQYHHIMAIVGQACGKCPKCASGNRVQGLIDTIIDIRFPDLDTALFRDGILSEFGFDDFWNELIVAEPEVRKLYVKYEEWYPKIWEDIEKNDDLPAISKVIEEEFCRSRDFRRILAGKKSTKSKWEKMNLLLFVVRMRRIRAKLEERPQTQEKQETQTIKTTAKNRKTRDKEKRRKIKDREDKVVAKLIHEIHEERRKVTTEVNKIDFELAKGESTRHLVISNCGFEDFYAGWEQTLVFLPFMNIGMFVSLMMKS